MRLDDAWWLVIVAVTLTGAAYGVSAAFGYSGNLLLLFGFLSGVIFALTNANDRRAVNGRLCLAERRSYDEVEFLAVAGLLGVAVTLVLLPVMYFLFSPSLNYTPQLWQDITAGFSVSISFGPIAVPWFVLAGLFTILSTLAYLYVVRSNTVELLAILGPVIYIMDILAGLWLFGDQVKPYEKFVIFPVVVTLFLLLSMARPREAVPVDQGSGGSASDLRRTSRAIMIGTLLVYTLVTFFVDLSIRSALQSFSGSRQFFVSLCFRAAYSSLYIVFAVSWWVIHKRSAASSPGLKRRIRAGSGTKLVLAVVTPVTFSLALALRIPVVANNLAVGPIIYCAGQTLALGVVGVLYGTDGTATKRLARFAQVYVRPDGQGLAKYAYVALYVLLFAVVILWLALRLISA